MKRSIILLCILPGLASQACTKDDILGDFPSSDTTEAAGDDHSGSDIETDADDDMVSATTFERTVTVTFSDSEGASVEGASDAIEAVVDGNRVTLTNNGSETVVYRLTGSSTDGCFKLYSSRKQEILLDGLSLANPRGAAVNNQSHKRTFVVLRGANTLSDGPSYTETPSDEDEKAAFFSEGQLVFSGDGSLTVRATGKAGITSDDYVRFMDGATVDVSSSAGHGVRGKQAVIVSDGTVNVEVSGTGKKGFSSDTLVYIGGGITTILCTGSAGLVDDELTGAAGIKADLRFVMDNGILNVSATGTGAKGICGDNVAYFNGGTATVTASGANYGNSSSGGFGGGFPGGFRPGGNSSQTTDTSKSSKAVKFDGNIYVTGGTLVARSFRHEGIEAKGNLTVTGGEVFSQASDDAINCAGDMVLEGGRVCAWSTGNDGLDANGDLYIKGGLIYAIGSGGAELAIDANSEAQKKLYFSGGTLVALGGLENGASLSQKCFSTSSWSKDTWYGLSAGEVTFVFKTPSSAGSPLVVSGAGTPVLSAGVSYSGGTDLFDGTALEGVEILDGSAVSLSSYSGGSEMGGGMGHGGFGW